MKKLFFVFCCALCLASCSKDNQQEASTTTNASLDVCYSSVSATQSVAMYALEKGIYAKHNLDVNLSFIGGGSKATSAMISGEMDICQIAGSAVVNGVVADTGLVLIAGLFNTYVYSLMVTPDIKSAADLKGKALAVSSIGSSSDAAIRAVLRALKLRPDDDVAILAIGGQSTRLAAMETERVVGTVVSVPQTAQARALGYRELVNMAELSVPFQHTALSTSRSFLESNPAVATRFLQATIEAIAQMKQDKEGVIAVLAQYLLLDVEKDAAILEEAFNVLIQGYLPDMPYPTAEGVQAKLDALVAENPAAANYKPSDVIDTTLLEKIEKISRR